MLLKNIRYAARVLRNAPAFTAATVLILALAIGVNTAMFSIVDSWFLRPLHFKNADELVIVLRKDLTHPNELPFFDFYRDLNDWKGRVEAFQGLGGMFWRQFTLTGAGETEQFNGMIVTAGLFETLGSTAQLGRVFTSADLNGGPVVVISHQFWQRRFGGAGDMVGRSLTLNDKAYRVIGILPPSFSLRMENQPFDPNVLALAQPGEPQYSGTATGPLAIIGRLKPGVSMQSAEAELSGVQTSIDAKNPDAPKRVGVFLTGLQDDNMRFVRTSLLTLVAAVGFVLLVACANVAGLLMGRASMRRRELAVRSALGAGRGGLVSQLLTESLLLAATGGALGLLLAYGVIRGFVAANPFALLPPDPIGIDLRVLAFALGLVCLTTIVFGTAPALQASRVDPGDFLKSRGSGAAARMRSGRGALAIFQIALSLVLLAGSALMARKLLSVRSQPLGFDTARVSVVELTLPRAELSSSPEHINAFYSQLLARVSALPGVDAAAIGNVRPLAGGPRVFIEVEGRDETPAVGMPDSHEIIVTTGYFSTLSIPILEGRGFTDADAGAEPGVTVVSEMVARRLFPGADALGHRIRTRKDGPWLTIVGVAGTVRTIFYNTLHTDPSPDIFVAAAQTNRAVFNPIGQNVWLFVRGQSPMTMAMVRREVDAIDRNVAVGAVNALAGMIAGATDQPRIRTVLVGGFGVLALILAAIGIYGLLAQSTTERTPEIAIRMAIGARPADVLGMILKQALAITTAGIALGVSGAILLARVLSAFLYGIPPVDPVAYTVVVLAVIAAGVGAAYVPARRASRVDPMAGLRHE